jgi:hypothetical protein
MISEKKSKTTPTASKTSSAKVSALLSTEASTKKISNQLPSKSLISSQSKANLKKKCFKVKSMPSKNSTIPTFSNAMISTVLLTIATSSLNSAMKAIWKPLSKKESNYPKNKPFPSSATSSKVLSISERLDFCTETSNLPTCSSRTKSLKSQILDLLNE